MIRSTIRKPLTILFTLLIVGLYVTDLCAQRRITYETLAARGQDQGIYLDYFTLPSANPDRVLFVTTARVNYSAIPFKKADDRSPDHSFYSPLTLNIEVFKSEKSRMDDGRENVSIEGLEPVSRDVWRDTAYAESYEQTKGSHSYIEGYLQNDLAPGNYSYIFRLTRGEDTSEESSRSRTVRLLSYHQKHQGNVILAESFTDSARPRVKLLNFGNNVHYGKDFFALVHLPGHSESDRYNLSVREINITRRDTSTAGAVYSGDESDGTILNDVHPRLTSDDEGIYLSMAKEGRGAYLVLRIPNKNFENSVYRLTVKRMGRNVPVAQSVFRSKWINMPVSLLNLEVAVNMLRFIEDDETIMRLKTGSEAQTEKKFKNFWDKMDPTPDTEFNELMAEYYRRIDYAYNQFSTINTSGYNTDRGKIYIRYGPPDHIERTYPANEPAMEIWTYGSNRTFVFRATSDFGDFKLIKSSDQ